MWIIWYSDRWRMSTANVSMWYSGGAYSFWNEYQLLLSLLLLLNRCWRILTFLWLRKSINPLDSTCNYSATSNNKKLVHWPLMGGLLHFVQRRGVLAGWGSAQSPHRCTKCNSPPINGQCTNRCIAITVRCSVVLMWRLKGYKICRRVCVSMLIRSHWRGIYNSTYKQLFSQYLSMDNRCDMPVGLAFIGRDVASFLWLLHFFSVYQFVITTLWVRKWTLFIWA